MIPPVVTVPSHEKPLRHHAWQLMVGVGALMLVLVVAGVLQIRSGISGQLLEEDTGVAVVDTRPPFTEEVKQQLAESKGFAALVSYTDRGFEPRILSIKKGDAVRFTNNTKNDLWVVAIGDTRYPVVADGCGDSALDSCRAISPGAFWEFTFEEAGEWGYGDKLNTSMTGTIVVE